MGALNAEHRAVTCKAVRNFIRVILSLQLRLTVVPLFCCSLRDPK
jgi:hypothetical protein